MDPCMGALPDTSASAYRHLSHTEDRKTEQEKRGKKQEQYDNKMSLKFVFLKVKWKCMQDQEHNYREVPNVA